MPSLHSFLKHGSMEPNISQGSVPTYARCGGILNNRFTANLLANLLWKNMGKSLKTR